MWLISIVDTWLTVVDVTVTVCHKVTCRGITSCTGMGGLVEYTLHCVHQGQLPSCLLLRQHCWLALHHLPSGFIMHIATTLCSCQTAHHPRTMPRQRACGRREYHHAGPGHAQQAAVGPLGIPTPFESRPSASGSVSWMGQLCSILVHDLHNSHIARVPVEGS